MPEVLRIIVPPINDFSFKAVFAHLGPLIGLLQAFLGLPHETFKGIFVADPNLNPDFEKGKHSILDLRARTATRDMNIEIQRLFSPELLDRILYYMARMMAGQLKWAEGYAGLPKTICILIADFPIPQLKAGQYHYCFMFRDEKSGLVYPNSPDIHVLALPEIPEVDDGTPLWLWGRFLSSKTAEELEALRGRGADMAEAVDRLLEFSADEKERIRAEAHEKWLWDQAARERQHVVMARQSREEGEAKGRAEGKAEEQTNIALSMLRSDMSVANVAKFTGLSEAEVKRYAKERK